MAKIKPLWWFIGIGVLVAIILVAVLIITRVLIDPPLTWWWFGGTLILILVLGAISGVIFVIYRMQKAQPEKVKLDPKTAKEKAIKDIQYDEHNPDNFKIQKEKIWRVGEPGKPRTTILQLSGFGTELNQKIDVLINLDTNKLEMSRIDGGTDEEIRETIMRMAEYPEIEEVDKTSTSFDPATGRYSTEKTTKRLSKAEKEMQENKEQADLANTY